MANWGNLPEHILTIIFSYVSFDDKMSLFLVCKYWNHCADSAALWRHFSFDLIRPEDLPAQIGMLRKRASDITFVKLHVLEKVDANLDNACTVIGELTDRQCPLESFTLCGSGADVVWNSLFSKILKSLTGMLLSDSTAKLRYFSCSEMKFQIGDGLLTRLAQNHPDLETVAIQTPSTSVTPFSVKILVRSCPKLKNLSMSYSSMSEDVATAIVESNHRSLRTLSLAFGAGRSIRRRISSEVWRRLGEHLPELRVRFAFSFLCTEKDVGSILQPGIPLDALTLNALFEASKEVALIEANYGETLEKFTITAAPSPELERALLSLIQKAGQLRHFSCFADLGPTFKEAVRELKPDLHCDISVTDDFDRNFLGFMTGRTADLSKLKELGYL